ncbi:hypothetical protein DRE_01539 [Drechslerella stenobrocha 248]|uniref:Uncharacterized protein n=1 Tax=Drechslerella stenobrocha 248 TaxID=1043628 RepID=W7HUA1_9PEZI|nr:hypothetical protein DRE_01539 [Drechslerella stenobrocha 248]
MLAISSGSNASSIDPSYPDSTTAKVYRFGTTTKPPLKPSTTYKSPQTYASIHGGAKPGSPASRPSRPTPSQIHMYYNQPKLVGLLEGTFADTYPYRTNDTRSHKPVIRYKPNGFQKMLTNCLEMYKDGKDFCTTYFRHNGKNETNLDKPYSEATLCCLNGYAAKLWNMRKNDGDLPRDVRIYCKDAMLLANSTLTALLDEGRMDVWFRQHQMYKGDTLLTSAHWSKDLTWGVSTVHMGKGGCPKVDDKLQWTQRMLDLTQEMKMVAKAIIV